MYDMQSTSAVATCRQDLRQVIQEAAKMSNTSAKVCACVCVCVCVHVCVCGMCTYCMYIILVTVWVHVSLCVTMMDIRDHLH